MTHAELLTELGKRGAIIVHCSRPGKGNEGISGRFFPDDLRYAMKICAEKHKELCCSVIWPEHIKTFGAFGIVLKPRTTESITSIGTIDSGTSLDPNTCQRIGNGAPFSKQTVSDTFAQATGYNEWNVKDAQTIGIFVHPTEPLHVPKIIQLSEFPGYDPAMSDDSVVAPVRMSVNDIATEFSDLPIFTYRDGTLKKWSCEGAECAFVDIDNPDIYLCDG